MTIDENATVFNGRPVEDFDPVKGIQDVRGTVYRLRVDWETSEAFEKTATSGAKKGGLFQRLFSKSEPSPVSVPSSEPEFDSAFQKLFLSFLSDPAAKDVTALVIGDWGQASTGNGSAPVVAELMKAKQQLASLQALFIGDMIVEESEISWIIQSDLSPLWTAYPNLETLRIRGGTELVLGNLSLPKLRTLIIESGGLPKTVLDQVCNAKLPMIEHLELWLGDSGYGWDGSIAQLGPILEGKLFPKLKYLGLRDSEVADAVAEAVAIAPVLSMIETLDLSLGTLSDKGAGALLDSPTIKRLKKLDVHHHYLSDGMMAKLKALPCEVCAEEQQEEDKDGGEVNRYVAVSE